MTALEEAKEILNKACDIGEKEKYGGATQEDIDNMPSIARLFSVILTALIELDERTKK